MAWSKFQWKISAGLLLDFSTEKWKSDPSDESRKRHLMVCDLYIKAKSYALINKPAFLVSILFGIMVLVWPSIAIILKGTPYEWEFLKSAIVQTTVTGLAALAFALYSNYKKRQMHMENLMRYVIYSSDTDAAILERVTQEMERIDSGFAFSESLMQKKGSKKDED